MDNSGAWTPADQPGAERLAQRLLQFRAELTPGELSAFDAILFAAVGDTEDVVAHGVGPLNTPVGRLAHALGVSATALAIFLSVGANAAPASAASLTAGPTVVQLQGASVADPSVGGGGATIVAQGAWPDLRITAAWADPSVNGVSTVHYTIKNVGEADAGAFSVAIMRYSIVLTEFRSEKGLRAGHVLDTKHDVQIGDATLIALQPDSRQELPGPRAFGRDMTVQRRADLTVSNGQASPVRNNMTDLSFRVDNTGGASAPAFHITVYDERNNVLGEMVSGTSKNLLGGYGRDLTMTGINVGNASRVQVVVDSHREVAELDGANNSLWITLSR